MKQKSSLLTWVPRIIMLISIALFILLSVDVFDSSASFWKVLGGFLVHNIPTFFMAAALFIAWHKPLPGGTASLMLAFGFLIFFRHYQYPGIALIIEGPLLISGIIFILTGINQRSGSSKTIV
ncbi:MAG: hypothetical protein CVU39_25905 [Chloroflexi bacterium HGW-Chloroflexi-10]|nr:MAG: hypothetical protein CVU39_25905 [Chloroflexi bacterium HGW-Chloroflexi-10]